MEEFRGFRTRIFAKDLMINQELAISMTLAFREHFLTERDNQRP